MTSSSKVANISGAGGDDDLQKKLVSPSGLPVREIPGGYGVPFFSPLRDRLDYYYFQGAEEYFRSRIARHGGATVLRVNMPPGPFITGSGGSRVVALLDARSYSVLLDDARVDKTDTLDGTFVPPLALFGGHRPMAFLDAADPRHAALKRVAIRLSAARMHHVAPAFHASFAAIFDAVDADVGTGRGVQFNKLNEHHMFDFTCAALFGGKPPSQAMGDGAVTKAIKWLALQLHPLASKIIRPWPLEDLLLHTFRLPPFLVRRDYAALTAYFADAASAVLDDAENKSLQQSAGVTRDELLHNLVFLAIFNAYGGFKIFLPHIIKWLARAGPNLHAKLAAEVRAAAAPHGKDQTITVQCIERSMPLVKSVVWESLRMNPPVEFQYARAREDMVVESHDAAYKVRKGEMLFGYQSLATRDPRVFGARAGEFVADRFVGTKGQELLGSVVWSNGPENGVAAEGNKQCPGKDMVVAVGRLLVAELFRRYDTFEAEVEEMPLEPFVTFTSMTKAKAAAAAAGAEE